MSGRRRRPRAVLAALACLLAGLGLLIPFEDALPVALGIAALLAFVVLGTAAIADPDYLLAEPEREADEG
jgi:hypothetical protein